MEEIDEPTPEDAGSLGSNTVVALSQVAVQLLAKFSIGRLYDPIHAKRMNEAENKNRLQDAKTDLEIARIKADVRMVNEQINIDKTVDLAVGLLSSTAKPDGIAQEWINYVQEKLKVVADEDMRNLWAKIISGEAENPGRFSTRVLDEVSKISKDEASAFTQAGGFVWTFDGNPENPLLVSDEHHHLWNPHQPLARTNLIEHQPLYISKDEIGKTLVLSYYGRSCELRIKRDVTFSSPRLTQIGRALFPICGSKPIENEFANRVRQWSSSGMFEIVNVF